MVIHTLFVILGIPVTNLKDIIEIKHAIEKFNESQKNLGISIHLKPNLRILFSWWKLVNRHLPTFKYFAIGLRHPSSEL